MHDNVAIRYPNGCDAPKMLAYLRRLGAETDNLTFGAGEPQPALEEERCYLERANGNGMCFFAAFSGPEVIGTIQLQSGHRPRTCHRAELAIGVLRRWWGSNVAPTLFARALAWAEEQGITKIDLSVRADNLRAKAFYAKNGFRREGICTRFFRLGDRYCDGEYWGLEL